MQKTLIALVRKIDDTAPGNDNAAQFEPVEIRNYPSNSLATIYSDNGITQISNPITSDNDGMTAFYAANGRYSLTFPNPSIPDRTDVLLLNDPADEALKLPEPFSTVSGVRQSRDDLDTPTVYTCSTESTDGGDRYGIVNDIAVNERVYNEEGILIEGESTNLILHSQDFDNAVWSKVAGASVTPNNAISPDGTLNADTCNNLGQLTQGVAGLPSGTYTASIWARSVSGNDSFTLRLRDSSQSEFTDLSASTTENWNLYKVSLNYTLTTNLLQINLRGTGANNIVFWCAQLEGLPFSTSPIKTAASPKTRGERNLTSETIGSIPQLTKDHSISINLTEYLGQANGNDYGTVFDVGGAGVNLNVKTNIGNNRFQVLWGAALVNIDGAHTGILTITYESNTNTTSFYIDGVLRSSNTNADWSNLDLPSGAVYIGRDENNGSGKGDHANCNIGFIKTWQKTLTAQEVTLIC